MTRSAGILGVPMDAGGARHIAARSRGTPRIANRLLRRVRDFVEVRAEGTITAEAAVVGLDVFGVDELGLDKVDRAILDVLCRRFTGRPVGLTTLAQCIGEEPDTIEDAYEPYLLQQGLLQRTTRPGGRTPGLCPPRPGPGRRHPALTGAPVPSGPAGGGRRSATMVPVPVPPAPTSSAAPAAAGTRDPTPMAAYDYGLPASAVAQTPVEPRSAARLLVGPGLVPGTGREEGPTHATMADLPGLLRPGDVLVVNDTSVLAARLELVKATGGRAEVLLVGPAGPAGPSGWWWQALVRPARRLPEGTGLHETGAATGAPTGPAVVEVGPALPGGAEGSRRVRLVDPGVVARSGVPPLPPYIRTSLADPSRYQTVYAAERELGDRSAAAPTAGLHFTAQLLRACEAAGARIARVDLAIGLDTFRPVTVVRPEDHVMHSERYTVPPATVAACATAERVVAVGTTAVRALEAAAATGELSGRTDLYIRAGFPFRVVDVLVTNFHLPRSTLLLLVEAFCGPCWRELYATAARWLPVPLLRRRHGRGPGRGQGHPRWTVPGGGG